MTTLAPTHFCNQCGALWRQCDNGSWNLRSEKAGPCCDNVAMGSQIQPLVVPSPHPTDQSSREQELRGLLREWQQAYNRMDDVGVSVADFQSLRRRTHEALSSPIAITAEEAGREGEAKDAARYREVLKSGIPWSKDVCFTDEQIDAFVDKRIDERLAAMKLPPAPAQSGGQGNG